MGLEQAGIFRLSFSSRRECRSRRRCRRRGRAGCGGGNCSRWGEDDGVVQRWNDGRWAWTRSWVAAIVTSIIGGAVTAVLGVLIGTVIAEGEVVANELADVAVIGHAVTTTWTEVGTDSSAVEAAVADDRVLVTSIWAVGHTVAELWVAEARGVVPALGVAGGAVVASAELLLLVAAIYTRGLSTQAEGGGEGAHTSRGTLDPASCCAVKALIADVGVVVAGVIAVVNARAQLVGAIQASDA
jgi:hypothetical protein